MAPENVSGAINSKKTASGGKDGEATLGKNTLKAGLRMRYGCRYSQHLASAFARSLRTCNVRRKCVNCRRFSGNLWVGINRNNFGGEGGEGGVGGEAT